MEAAGRNVEPGSAAWWRLRLERDRRRRPRADGLSTARLIVAALDLVDREGLDGLTVRRLAAEFDTGSASLYRHVASRDELLVLMVDHIFGGVVAPDADLDPRARVEHLALEMRRVLMEHPAVLPALGASPLLGPNLLRGGEHAIAALVDLGFEPATAVRAHLALIDYVLGTVFFDTSRAGRLTTAAHSADLQAATTVDVRYRDLPNTQAAFAAGLFDGEGDDVVFWFGLHALLDGLEARYGAGGDGVGPSVRSASDGPSPAAPWAGSGGTRAGLDGLDGTGLDRSGATAASPARRWRSIDR